MDSQFGLEVLTLCGSIRKASFNAALIRALPELAPGGMRFLPAPSVADFPLYDGDLEKAGGAPQAAVQFGNAMRAADALIIASPEYNYSVPGTLKNALDWISRLPGAPLANRPVLIQSASMGPLGGTRMQYHLRQVLVGLGALVFTKPEIMVGTAQTKFDEAGKLVDAPTRDLVRSQLAAFAAFVVAVTPPK